MSPERTSTRAIILAVSSWPVNVRLVLIAFVVLAIAPFAVAATRSSFWQRQHSMAPVATALYLGVVVALVVGRYRWAWITLAVFYAVAFVIWAFDDGRFSTRSLVAVALDALVLALLLSLPMRDRLRRRVTMPQGHQARRG
jgi:hypothetical protein